MQLELRVVNESLLWKKRELKGAEVHLKENRSKAEDARTELMLTEFKRDTVKKDLSRTGDEVKVKEQQLRDLEPQLRVTRAAEHAKVESLQKQLEGLQGEQQVLLRKADLADRERDSLISQLNTAKHTTAREQEAARLHLQNKSSELETLRWSQQEELEKERSANVHDTAHQRRQLQEMALQLSKLQGDVVGKENANTQMREKLTCVLREAQEEKEEKDLWKQQRVKLEMKVHSLKAQQHDVTLARDGWEKQNEDAMTELEKEHSQKLWQVEQTLKQRLSDLQGRLTAKDLEVEVLRDHLKQHEITTQEHIQSLKKEAQENLSAAVLAEKECCAAEVSSEVQRETLRCSVETQREMDELRDEVATERALVGRHQKQVTALKKELEEVRQLSRMAELERQSNASQLQQSVTLDRQRQIDLVRDTVDTEALRTVEALRERLRGQDGEIARLRLQEGELAREDMREEDGMARDVMEECRRMTDLLPPNGCTASRYSMLRPSLRRPFSQHRISLSMALSNLRVCNEEIRQQIHDLKQEITRSREKHSSMESDMKGEVERLKERMHTEKLEAMEKLKDMLIKEHLSEVDRLHKSVGKGKGLHRSLRQKDRELQEVQHGMASWKDRTADKLAKKFHEEMEREMEKKASESRKISREWKREKEQLQNEIDRLRRQTQKTLLNGYPVPLRAFPRSALDDGSTRHMRQLQDKLSRLQEENTSLRRAQFSSSVPDLSAILGGSPLSQAVVRSPVLSSPLPTTARQMRDLETRTNEAEKRASLAEQRSVENTLALDHKTHDVCQLQGTLTQQTKELMQLERAYSKLQGLVPQPNRHNLIL